MTGYAQRENYVGDKNNTPALNLPVHMVSLTHLRR